MKDKGIEIRALQAGDFDSAMELVRRCYGRDAEPPEWWKWRHFDPSLDGPIIFGAFDDSTVVGIRPMAHFPFSLGGQALSGAVFSAVMVHPDFRRQGLFSGLVAAGCEKAWRRGSDFIMTMPNDVSGQAFKRLGWMDPGLRTLMVLPIDIPAIGRTKRIPGWIAGLGWSLTRFVAGGIPQVVEHQDVLITEVATISKGADDLADQICRRYEGLMLHRSSSWWNWRFRGNNWNQYRRFEARQANGMLSGVLATATEERGGLLVGYVADFLGVDAKARQALVSKAVQRLTLDGAQVIASVLSDRTTISEFRSMGFLRLPNSLSPKKFRTMFLPSPANPWLVDRLGKIENWYQTLGDWDGI